VPELKSVLIPDADGSPVGAVQLSTIGVVGKFAASRITVNPQHVNAQVHLEAILPAVLGGLADESEGVRSAALAAGRTLVSARLAMATVFPVQRHYQTQLTVRHAPLAASAL